MFGKKTAHALDTAATKASALGSKVGGETGANIADALVNVTLAPIRSRINEPCTCGTNCDH